MIYENMQYFIFIDMPLIYDQIYKRWSFSINLKIKIKHAMYPLPCNLVSVFNVVVVAFIVDAAQVDSPSCYNTTKPSF